MSLGTPPVFTEEDKERDHAFHGADGRGIDATSSGEHQMADIELGKKVVEKLEELYPRHNWYVEASHRAGTVTIQLCYPTKGGKLRVWNHGYLLHISNLQSAKDLHRKVMQGGGELLERAKLARSGANPYTAYQARENGLDTSNMVR